MAAERLAKDEDRITGSRRTNVSLGQAWTSFWRHPSPYLIGDVPRRRPSWPASSSAAAPGGSW